MEYGPGSATAGRLLRSQESIPASRGILLPRCAYWCRDQKRGLGRDSGEVVFRRCRRPYGMNGLPPEGALPHGDCRDNFIWNFVCLSDRL